MSAQEERRLEGGEAGVVGRRSRRSPFRRIARYSAILAFVVLAGFAIGLGWFANHIAGLAPPADPRTADGIIVLTGGQFRLDAAVALLKSGKGKRLLISGVNPIAADRDIQSVTGADRHLFACCIDIDRAAIDTIGNAAESAKWVRDNGYRTILLVTNNYHMPRSLLEMRRFVGEADVEPYPVVNTRLDQVNWMANPDAVRVIVVEYTKYLAALARGALGKAGIESRLVAMRPS